MCIWFRVGNEQCWEKKIRGGPELTLKKKKVKILRPFFFFFWRGVGGKEKNHNMKGLVLF